MKPFRSRLLSLLKYVYYLFVIFHRSISMLLIIIIEGVLTGRNDFNSFIYHDHTCYVHSGSHNLVHLTNLLMRLGFEGLLHSGRVLEIVHIW